ncbi:MAG: hypothetical protein KAH18_05110 [Psychromonas sp.]|nr:hypothetical protein [Psychromonas sp.]
MSTTGIYSTDETDHTISIEKNKLFMIFVLFIVLIVTVVFLMQGYYAKQIADFKMKAIYNSDVSKDKYLKKIEIQSDQKLILLAKKLGVLQAKVERLNTLSVDIIKQSKFPSAEFNFLTSQEDNFNKKKT